MKKFFNANWFLYALLALLLAGCGPKDPKNDESQQSLVGVFNDAIVSGLNFSTSSRTGITNVKGEFTYLSGEVVSFSIGDVFLGSTLGKPDVTPLDLVPESTNLPVDIDHPQVVNTLRLLQTLDVDDFPDNGIEISASAKDAAIGTGIDLTNEQSVQSFESDSILLQFINTVNGKNQLIAADVAQQHFEQTLSKINGDNLYIVGGNVVGLTGSLTLSINNGTNKVLNNAGKFSFDGLLVTGSDYNIGVVAQPSGQTCTVQNGAGVVAEADIFSTLITCIDDTQIDPEQLFDGTTSGLIGTLILRTNDNISLHVNSDGSSTPFEFVLPVTEIDSFPIVIETSPTNQSCEFVGQSSVTRGNSQGVEILCSFPKTVYTVSGKVNGLTSGTLGLKLESLDTGGVANAEQTKTITVDGSYLFELKIEELNGYRVTAVNPPGQTCLVSNASSTSVIAEVGNVDVTCTVNSFFIDVSVNGLVSSTIDLKLEQLDGNGVTIAESQETIAGNVTAFRLTEEINELNGFRVTVVSPPGEICTVENGFLTSVIADVTNVQVTCSTKTHFIGGSIQGHTGTLTLQNNGTDDLDILATDTSFKFLAKVADGSGYAVSVLSQPVNQECEVTKDSGVNVTAEVTDVGVTCVNTYSVSGNITLAGVPVDLKLEILKGSDLTTVLDTQTIPLSNVTSFAFDKRVKELDGYRVTAINPPGQTCLVSNKTSTSVTADVGNVDVTCTVNSYFIDLSVKDLVSATINLKLEQLDGNGVTIAESQETIQGNVTDFRLTEKINELNGFRVTVTNPPGETCTVENGFLASVTANVTNVVVTCRLNVFTIGGSVTGLASSTIDLKLVELDSSGATIATSQDTIQGNAIDFRFTEKINESNGFQVTAVNPPGQTCTVKNGSASTVTTNVVDVLIDCANQFTVSGEVEGLDGTLVLRNNSGNDLTVSADLSLVYATSFAFTQTVSQGESYNVSVLAQPSDTVVCTVENGNADNIVSDIADVSIVCADRTLVANVSIGDTDLSGCVSTALVGLTYADELKTLDCSNMSIEEIDGIESLTGLIVLDLSDNTILHIDALSDLVNLEYLNMLGNPIPLIQQVADFMKAGSAFELGSCVEEHIVPNKIESVDQLTELNCSGRSIESLEHIGKLRYLKKIDLSSNSSLFVASSPDDIPPFYDSDYAELQKLIINPILFPSPLEVLNLRKTDMDTLHWLKDFSNLKNINISDNRVSDIAPLAKAPVKNVRGGFTSSPGIDDAVFEQNPHYALEVVSAGDVVISFNLDSENLARLGNHFLFAELYNESGVVLGSAVLTSDLVFNSPISVNLNKGIYKIIVFDEQSGAAFDYSLDVAGDDTNGTAGDAFIISPLKYLGATPCSGCQSFSDITPLTELHNLRHLDISNNTAINDASVLVSLPRLTNVGIAGTNINSAQLPVDVSSILLANFVSGSEVDIDKGETSTSSIIVYSDDVIGLTTDSIKFSLNVLLGEGVEIADLVVTLKSADSSEQIINVEAGCDFNINSNVLTCTNIEVNDFSNHSITTGGWLLRITNNTNSNLYGEVDAVLKDWGIRFDNDVVKTSSGLGMAFDAFSSQNFLFPTDDIMITGMTDAALVASQSSITVDHPSPGNAGFSIDVFKGEGSITINNTSSGVDGVLQEYSLEFEYGF